MVGAVRGSVIINDPTMAAANYSLPGYNAALGTGPAGTMTAASLGAGGHPGAYRLSTYTAPATPAFNISYFSEFNVTTTWNPSVTPISTVAMGLDTFSVDVDGSGNFAVLFAVRQGGNVYTNFVYHTVPNTAWNLYTSALLTQSSFQLTGSPGNNPNFSATGGIVEFGFEFDATLSNRPSAIFGYQADNFCVAVNGGSCAGTSRIPTPEPASWALVILPLGMIGWRRLRKGRVAIV